jgi:hydrogenase-4 component F
LLPLLLLLTPAVTALLCRLARPLQWPERISAVGALLTAVLGVATAAQAFGAQPLRLFDAHLYLDALSGLLLLIVSLVGPAAALVSVDYMRHEVQEGTVTPPQLRWYYCWLHLSIFTMLAVPMVNNLGILWAAVEGTTLVTAMLVGFYGRGASLEAAWKYLFICTVGIAFALFGVLLVYYAGQQVVAAQANPLNWDTLQAVAGRLDPRVMRLCFVFVLIGFGTKAGLAPMHTWLPDAHSQAPSPVSALLSGALLNCALYAIFRFHLLAVGALGPDFSSHLLLAFGMLSVVIAVPFILVQHDLKRLLAYSSVEHVGIIALGVGIGGPLALFAAAFHMLNHALTKAVLFFAAGRLGQQYGTLRLPRMRGAVRAAPLVGWIMLLGGFAITGTPPFATFASEFGIIAAGFGGPTSGPWTITASVVLLVALAFVFAGLLRHTIPLTLGNAPSRLKVDHGSGLLGAILIVPVLFLVLAEFWLPPPLSQALRRVALVLAGGQ